MTGYENKIELKMQRLFETLSEKDKRRYAAIEAEKLPHGGTDYISILFRIDPKTIRRGKAELDQAIDEAKGRIRKKGAERNVQ
jgi:hypothetical protein